MNTLQAGVKDHLELTVFPDHRPTAGTGRSATNATGQSARSTADRPAKHATGLSAKNTVDRFSDNATSMPARGSIGHPIISRPAENTAAFSSRTSTTHVGFVGQSGHAYRELSTSNPAGTESHDSSFRPENYVGNVVKEKFEERAKDDTSAKQTPFGTDKAWTTKASTSSVNGVNFTQDSVSLCLRQNGSRTAFINRTQMYISQGATENVIGDVRPMTCTINITAPPGNRIKAEIWSERRGECSTLNYVNITDGTYFRHWLLNDCGFDLPYFMSKCAFLMMRIRVGDTSVGYFFVIKLFAKKVELEVVPLSPNQGYVQTPGFDEGRIYWSFMDVWTDISPPPGHVTLLSLRKVDLEKTFLSSDVVEVYAGGKGLDDRVWSVAGTSPPLPTKVTAPSVLVHFCSNRFHELSGFRLLYTYHTHRHQPRRVPGGLWNCSVPEWQDFQRHFLCDVDTDCEGGKDEAQCFYRGHCGKHHLTLNKRYVLSERSLSWEDASLKCINQGGYLASLNTADERKAVLEFLEARRSKVEVVVGLKAVNPSLPILYRHSLQWADGSVAFNVEAYGNSYRNCGHVYPWLLQRVNLYRKCTTPIYTSFLCELPPSRRHRRRGEATRAITLESSLKPHLGLPFLECPAGHLTHAFLACDERSACWSRGQGQGRGSEARWGVPSRASCPAPMTSLPAMFACGSASQRVPYSVVCDHRWQCADGSDENFCDFPLRCSGSTPLQCGTSRQCVARDAYCNNAVQCADHTDESDCRMFGDWDINAVDPPAVITYDGTGFNVSRQLQSDTPCPRTHFRCPPDGYCVPVYLRCNGVADCPGKEDEAGCGDSVCPGFYRCWGSSPVCLHVSSVCDGVRHCPEQDDELYCHYPPCPHNCTCHALAFTCSGTFVSWSHPELRYLDAAGSGMRAGWLSDSTMLVHLSLASCGLKSMKLFAFPNLRSLVLSDNFITIISGRHLRDMRNLRVLILSGNPLTDLFFYDLNVTLTLHDLELLDISRAPIEEVDLSYYSVFQHLRTLNISNGSIRTLRRSDNISLRNLQTLDTRRCPLTHFDNDALRNLDDLHVVFAENFKLCCPVFLPPGFNLKNCHAPRDGVSSCDSLLSSTGHRVLLALCCCVALLGNLASIGLRVFVARKSSSSPLDVFLTHLGVGDAVMGVSVAVVAVADRLYQGSYALGDTAWRQSAACKTAGLLFLLSSQISVCLVFVVALTVLVSVLPIAGGFSFKATSAHAACAVVWAWCVGLVTLLGGDLVSQTAVCFPLFAADENLTAPRTSEVVIVVFNFALTTLSAAFHICNFIIAMQSNTATSDNNILIASLPGSTTSTARSRETVRVRRVFSPCGLSIACWIPLCGLAVLTWRGSPPPDALRVNAGLIAPPASSALRPILLALGARAERRRRDRALRLAAYVTALRRQKAKEDKRTGSSRSRAV